METEARATGSSDFGTLLRHYRLAAGLSQEALAERAGMSTNGIGALERGYRRSPQRETIALLARALALSDEQRDDFEEAAGCSRLPRRVAASVAVGPWPARDAAAFPLSLTSFVGREEELEQIFATVRAQRLVTLTGAGGVGKTQTALRAATAVCDANGSAVCFVGLAPIANGCLLVAAIAAAVGVQEVPHRPLVETLIAYLKNKTLLLILDNCEHLIADAAEVAQALLMGCPHLRILATSREPLRGAGERAYRLPSLIEKYSVVLFADRARSIDHHFTLTAENSSTVVEICRHLDGIPLAIELAAGRVNVLSLKALAAGLADRFRILTIGQRTSVPRQQTMRAAIDWSYNLLSAPEQRAFERLSIFAGGCTFAAATTVCAGESVSEASVLELLSSLVDKSLVYANLEGSEPRFGLLESFRQYAREKLATRDELQAVAHRHARASLQLTRWASRGSESHSTPLWVDRFWPEVENLRAAVEWTLTEGDDVLLAQRLACELSYWNLFSLTERRRWITRAFEMADESTPLDVLADLDLARGQTAYALRELESVTASCGKALAGYRVLQDSRGIARAAARGAVALTYLGRRAEAKTLLEEALPLARETKMWTALALMLRVQALGDYLDGDFGPARERLAEALQIYESMDSKGGAWGALQELAECEFLAGDAVTALKRANDALAASRGMPATTIAHWSITTLGNMSRYLVVLARYDEAREYARESLALARERQQDVLLAWNLENLAAIAGLRPQAEAERASMTYARAARILGFVNARLAALKAMRHPSSTVQYQRVLSVMNETLGTNAVVTFMTGGATMTEEQAVDLALAL
ncbi:MAG: helix-turn-helix domain-containing protein [Candidatus Cybelea sp.]